MRDATVALNGKVMASVTGIAIPQTATTMVEIVQLLSSPQHLERVLLQNFLEMDSATRSSIRRLVGAI
jgi:hypothetical protein